MDTRIKQLFQTICERMAVTAEIAANDKSTVVDMKNQKNAFLMRDNFQDLKDKLATDEPLTKKDYISLYAGAQLMTRQLDANINVWRKTRQQYQEWVIPKLKQVVDETGDFNALADEIFVLKDEQ